MTVKIGINDFATTHPELARDWDYNKNNLTPQDITFGSNKKFWWLCDLEHSYERKVKDKVKYSSCPYCSGSRVLPGFNDVATTHPEIIFQLWDFDKNKDIYPSSYTKGSKKIVWWKCKKGHSYQLKIHSRTLYGFGCKVCSSNLLVPGVNDLATIKPELLKYWDYEKNSLSPDKVSPCSRKKAWWKCDSGHSFYKGISDKDKVKNNDCRFCSGHAVLKGFNDISTTSPHLLEIWDYEKNKDISPEDVTFGSSKKVWWKCEKGHSYLSRVGNRSVGYGCPICKQCAHFISKQEANLVQWIKDTFPHLKVLTNTRKIISPKELDIYIPELSIAIEFNGIYWHSTAYKKDKNYHLNKLKSCKDKGIQLITIWEDDWLDSKKQTIVKSMLAHKFGMYDKQKIYARNTTIAEINSGKAREFCDNYHIQGASSGSLYLGLKDNKTNELVAVSIWRKLGDKFYLDRYCTSAHIIGGLGKMLESAKIQALNIYNCLHIVTFSDNEISDGGMYEKLGFIKDKELKPDYKYLHNEKRVHKFNFRKSRFKKDPELKYEENLTESQLAELNNLHKIYDCGKTRWVFAL